MPGSRVEATAIARRFPGATVLLGAEATEAALLGLTTPGVLHVATHGLFSAEARAVNAPMTSMLSAPVETDPMLRSAIALAGVLDLAAAPAAATTAGAPDGLVTALEVAGMNLWGTQLVVLSTCDSGLGEAQRGEGVYGLRRAVLVAGAQTLVMSLWSISDLATREFMAVYYDALCAGTGRVAALDTAAAAIRARRPHPSYWAPFVALGRGDPLTLPPTAHER